MNIVEKHTEVLPLVAMGEVTRYIVVETVLTEGAIGDFAAYRAAHWDSSQSEMAMDIAKIDEDSVARHGNKIPKEEAARLFGDYVLENYRR